MLLFRKTVIAAGALALSLSATHAQTPLYRDASAPVAQRVEDLLSRMTLEEKIGQMCQYVGLEHIQESERRRRLAAANNDTFAFYPGLTIDDLREMVRRGEAGSFLHVLSAGESNELQDLAAESRLGIPLLIGIDAIHGNGLLSGSTVYPSPITMAASFDPMLVEQIAHETAQEMRAMGSQWTFSPNIDVARDPRWGRYGETFGEDPFLVGELGAAMVRGYQGDALHGPDAVLACIKHLIAGSEPINGLNGAPMDVSERMLREVFLPPYWAALKEGPLSLMVAHHELNGVPCHANPWIVEALMRQEGGFKGFVVSDWMDIERLVTVHHVAETQKDAVRLAIEGGIDMHMHGPDFLPPLVELVHEGVVPEARIDLSVRRILEVKFALGLFEHPHVDLGALARVVHNAEHQTTALTAARRGIVLLKNSAGTLPVTGDRPMKLVVTGPSADADTILGDWVLPQPPENVVTILEGLRQEAPGTVSVEFADVGTRHRQLDERAIDAAVQRVAEADIAVVVVGDNALRYQRDDFTSGENVDRPDIRLPGNQATLARRAIETGKPVVIVLVNGRPLSEPDLFAGAAAVINALEPGALGGQALAEIIYGKVNPSGRLPFTIPVSVGHAKSFYYHKPSQYLHPYEQGSTKPTYEFGAGLSYTRFAYEDLTLPEVVNGVQDVSLSVVVRNAGDRAGDEVVLLYINDLVSSIATPVKKLVAVQRIHLVPGESRKMTFTLTPDQLSFLDAQLKPIVEPGEFQVFVGDQKASFRLTL